SRGPAIDERWRLYMAGDLYLTKYLHRFYERYQLALSDIAMMNLAEEKNELLDIHPGWRFSKTVKAAARLGAKTHEDGSSDLRKYMDGLTAKLEWITISQALAKLAHDQADHSIQEFDRSPEANTFWLAVLRASSKLHREWMQIRMQFPT